MPIPKPFDPSQYADWLTETQAAADLGIAPGTLSHAIFTNAPWTHDLRFLVTRLGTLYDPKTIDTASAALSEARAAGRA